jgi:serine/threonine protein kinase/tetratricopeptide (TPR) repeat protein
VTEERFARAREIFLDACERSPDERARALDEACGRDAELRAEVEELLRFHDADRSTPLHLSPAPDEVPETIGHYRPLRKLGEGGMGVVYEAEQREPIQRRVALKLIKWGLATKDVLARFEAERQALALMSHPSIARVFDAGATERGLPYFVMEYVPGIPLDEYCDTHRLSTRERLELFVQVCQGVQHAHQKGIIHRDLKPSNVLVTLQDGRPVPKIIDFGIAKATTQRLTERTVFTELGQWIGTPQYMSPEQAEMSGLDVDTRTDVYSRCVVLYELLVGAPPLDPETLRRSGFDEMRRRIREEEPPRPSTRVSRSGGDSEAAAQRRGTDSTGLIGQLRGDLDWITMRALEKDRGRRYASPAELAQDVERHLHDEPVRASPPSVTYRVGKFVRRHRLGVAAGALVSTALVLGLVLASVGMIRARRAERLANTQVELLIAMFDTLDPGGEQGPNATPQEILGVVAERIDTELVEQPLVQARLKSTMARIYWNLGSLDSARPLLEEALLIQQEALGPDHPDVGPTLRSLGTLLGVMGHYSTAQEHLEQALALDEKVWGPDHTNTASSLSELALVLWRNGDIAKAKPYAERALAIHESEFGPDHLVVAGSLFTLSLQLRALGELEAARAGFERALRIREGALGPDHTNVAWTLDNLGQVYMQLGDPAAAERLLERALSIQENALGPDSFGVIEPLLFLGQLRLSAGDLDGARQRFERALSVHETRFGPDHQFLGWSLDNLGNVAWRSGDADEARRLFERSLRLRETSLGPDHLFVATSLAHLGRLAFRRGDNDRARSLLERRLTIVDVTLGAEDPRGSRARIDMARVLVRTGDPDRAERLYQSSKLGTERAARIGGLLAPRHLYEMACLAARLGKTEDALVWLGQAFELGFASPDMLDEPDLASLRDAGEYEALVAKLEKRRQNPRGGGP